MGYMQGPPTRSKYKNTDTAQNHVDRVRVPDTSSYDFGGPGRGSGWRHRSLSNIDLTSQSKHSFTKQTKGYTSGLYDLYSRLETNDIENSENPYGNLSPTNADKVESIYDRIEQTLDTLNDSESCSLRRTRSLAVIREETFNDLQIGGSGIRTRRSQLIPRAKLLNRSFFQNRNTPKRKYRGEDDNNSGIDIQTSDNREPDDYYNLRKIQGSQLIQQALSDQKILPALWLNDKSDLDSLDSDYFKHSLHQLDGNYDDSTLNRTSENNRTAFGATISSSEPEKISSSEVVIETHYNGEEFTENEIENGNIPDYCTIQSDEVRVIDNHCNENISTLHIEHGDNCGTSTICHSSRCNSESDDNAGGDEASENIDRKTKFKEDHRSVISYDSIYLSSEGSNEATTFIEEGDIEEKINEYLSDNNYSTLSEYTHIRKELASSASNTAPNTTDNCVERDREEYENEEDKSYDDNLYSQIHKSKPKIVESTPKLTSFSDISSRGTLERLTFVSSPASTHKEFANDTIYADKYSILSGVDQYCSLPIANIAKVLQASERIDAKLRQSCNIPFDEQTKHYDSIAHFGRAHTKLRQRTNFTDTITSPIPSGDEKPKESTCIDLKPNVRTVLLRTEIPRPKLITEHSKNEQVLKIDEEIASLKSAADLTDVDACSSKDCQIDEIRRKPEKIKFTTESKTKTRTLKSLDTKIEFGENIVEETVHVPTIKIAENPIRHRSYLKSNHSKRHFGCGTSGRNGDKYHGEHRLNGAFKNNLSNTLKRRIESKTKQNAHEKTISKVVRNIDKSKGPNKHAKVHQSILENIGAIAQPNFNMSRPQIMNVIDSTRRISVTQRTQRNRDPEVENESTEATEQAHREFRHKVDSVRHYWSKLADDIDEVTDSPNYTFSGGVGTEVPKPKTTVTTKLRPRPKDEIIVTTTADPDPENRDEIEVCPQTITASNNTLKRGTSTRSLIKSSEREELNSFTPSVEIVELDDQKQATIVKVQNTDTDDFDHVRYKVVKSDTFQKNLLAPTRKETRFGGLLQYLHDYSFQDLLNQNNVVIIEPIRTKIEQISNKSNESQILGCKITAGAGKTSSDGKNSLKKHFFYHPIRVNKELLDEELPTPDTVRKAKKLFEETLLFRSMNANAGKMITGCKNIDGKYLTLEAFNGSCRQNGNNDNGNGGNIEGGVGEGYVCGRIKKWDSSSLSSGISSGDLSSPCDCNDNDDTKLLSNRNENELCESYYVSQDILEKIRECGSSVTYYGGRVLNNQSPEVSPMTKAIMREIHSVDNVCEVCQPNNCPHNDKLFTNFRDIDHNKHLGMKLRLIKSNSCNSRLEMTGIDDHRVNRCSARNHSATNLEHEDTVRNMIQRIESNQMCDKRVPRIIESKCIEKTLNQESHFKGKSVSLHELNSLSKSKSAERLGPMEILSHVSMKNHINSTGSLASISERPVMSRNKNVDLALEINKSILSKTTKEHANNTTKKETLIEVNGVKNKTTTAGVAAAIVHPTNLTKNEIQDKMIKENHKAIMQDLCKAVARVDEGQTNKMCKSRLVKWDTLGSFNERNYLASDAVTKQKQKYDDIEFEEFEVIEPNN